MEIHMNNKTNAKIPRYVLNKLKQFSNKSLDWAMHQKCKDMFVFSKWNGSMSEGSYDIDYDFGTDFGICCWFSPQLNLTEIREQFIINHLDSNPPLPEHWRMGQLDIDGSWFQNIEKGADTGKNTGFTMLVDLELFDYTFSEEGAEGLKVWKLFIIKIGLKSYLYIFYTPCLYSI